MKTDYLNKLKLLLDAYNMSDSEKMDIVEDYGDMYDNWIEHGMSETEVEDKLGKPDVIVRELTEGYQRKSDIKRKQKSAKNGKYIAITPFIALVAFFIIGFAFDGWMYSWTAFLLIPITAIFLEMDNDPHKLTALMPFLSGIVYLILGFTQNLWHPGWLVFMAIPITAILTERKSIGFLNTLVSLSPLVIVVTYLYLGFEEGLWVEAWPLFMIIPALAVLNEKNTLKVLLWEVLIIGGTVGYYYVGLTYAEWGYGALAFVPLALYSILQDQNGFVQMPRNYKIVVIAAFVLFALTGYITKEWGYVWVVFLAIPVYAIMTETKGNERMIALSPFVSLLIFYTLGWFFDFWAFSWMAFLLIPVVAIIKEA